MKYKLIINMKTYEQATSKKAIKLAEVCKKLKSQATKRNVEIILAGQAFDLKDIIKTKVTTFSQHVDVCTPGANTGWAVPKNIKSLGVTGSLISHSEHMLETKEVSFKATPKGCIGIYGLRRMPISLYKDELQKIREKIDDGSLDAFIEENKKLLK